MSPSHPYSPFPQPRNDPGFSVCGPDHVTSLLKIPCGPQSALRPCPPSAHATLLLAHSGWFSGFGLVPRDAALWPFPSLFLYLEHSSGLGSILPCSVTRLSFKAQPCNPVQVYKSSTLQARVQTPGWLDAEALPWITKAHDGSAQCTEARWGGAPT